MQKKQVTIECGEVRKAITIETDLTDLEIVNSMDMLDLVRNGAHIVSKYTFGGKK